MARWCCLVFLLLPIACSYDPLDPFQRPGTWTAQGDNDANLRIMVANPRDLIEGSKDTESLGTEAAPPVQRLFSGERSPLPVESASGISSSVPAAAQGGGGASSAQ